MRPRASGTASPGVAVASRRFPAPAVRQRLEAALSAVPRFGTGCGNAFVPTFDVTTSNGTTQHPFIGATFGLTLANLPPNAPAGIDLGISRTTFAGFALPLDLTLIGMTNCFLYQDRAVTYGLANVVGSASFRLFIPNSASLVGGIVSSSGQGGRE